MTLIQFLHKAANTIRYNGLYIFLAIVFPLVLSVFDAGREIIQSLCEETNQLNLSLCLVSFFLLGFSVWCIPTLAISIFQFFTGYQYENRSPEVLEKSREEMFNSLTKIYNDKSTAYQPNKTQFPIRWFAVFPWLMFLFTYYWVSGSNIDLLIEIITTIVLFIIGKRLFKKYKERIKIPKTGKLFLLICTIPFLSLLMLPYILGNVIPQSFQIYTYGFIAALSAVIFYYTLHLLEEKKTQYKLSCFNYNFMLIVLVLAILALYCLNQKQMLPNISPVIVLIIMAAAMITFFDLFITSQHLLIKIAKAKSRSEKTDVISFRLGIYQLFTLTLLPIFIILCLFSSLNSHRIRKTYAGNEYVSITQRPTFTKYFDTWFQKNMTAILKDSTIYLISGQGGGSRAAAWFFMNMALKEKQDSNFLKKTFSISTVSGSSVGAYMFLGAEYFNASIHHIDSVTTKLLGRNYMSSAFFGLLIGDGIDGIVNTIVSPGSGFPIDRNYHLQKEEMDAFKKTFHVDAKDFFEADYLQLYQDTTRMYPLFFINTAIVEKGTRGIFSPVQLDSISLAQDLYKTFKNEDHNGRYNIPMTTCVNQSEAFPLLSAYNYMDCTGRFIDGGLYENTGCETTLEIYQALRKYLNNPVYKNYNLRIALLNVINSSITGDYNVPFKKASILNSLTALVNSPFGGHQNYAYHNLNRQVTYMNQLFNNDVKDTVMNIPLNEKITLTRTLSDSSIRKMYNTLSN